VKTDFLKEFLDEKYCQYASSKFVESDPIQIPHKYSNPSDIEISAFLAATLAWGQRPMIIRYATHLMNLMGESPTDFILHYNKKQRQQVEAFQYRTFTGVDCNAFMQALSNIYKRGSSIKSLFVQGFDSTGNIKDTICYFRNHFIYSNFPTRTYKHISNPECGSASKRLNMFLRWMVRTSNEKVDFGLWPEIPTSALMLPLDLHTGRVTRKLGLLTRNQNDWKAVEEVTENLRIFDANDPVKYDLALFGLGVFEKF
jgi:uncharacterized protein (TIGR02757 family)